MLSNHAPGKNQFWEPEFTYEYRKDGSILMTQNQGLDGYFPLLADYLDQWAEAAPERTWLARRDDGGEWVRLSYRDAHQQARAIGAALLSMGLGPTRPLLILSENSLEHALLGIACAYVGIPYAPLSPAYSLVSKGAEKAMRIAELLQPGAIFADDGVAFAHALGVLHAADRKTINARNMLQGAVSFDDLLAFAPEPADDARACLTPDTVVKYLFT